MSLTEYTLDTSRCEGGVCRWHLNEKLALECMSYLVLNESGLMRIPAVFVLNILNCTSALDAADRETRAVSEAADHTRLPFQRALHRLVEIGRFIETNNINVAVRGCHDQKLVDDIHAVDSFLTSDRGHRIRLS